MPAHAGWRVLHPGGPPFIREEINGIVRERLVRDGTVRGPAMTAERLVSRGYTNAEKTLAANYAPGDVVAFRRPYKRLGVEKGDELRVAGVDRRARTVMLEGRDGQSVAWAPNRLAARAGGVEVYRAEEMELRHIDRSWASTVHAFQGRTVDTVIAAMEANHPHLTTLKTLYVEISRARDRAELVTDDKAALRERLEAVTGERIAALEAVEPERAKDREAGRDVGRSAGRGSDASESRQPERTSGPDMEKAGAPKGVDRDLGL